MTSHHIFAHFNEALMSKPQDVLQTVASTTYLFECSSPENVLRASFALPLAETMFSKCFSQPDSSHGSHGKPFEVTRLCGENRFEPKPVELQALMHAWRA